MRRDSCWGGTQGGVGWVRVREEWIVLWSRWGREGGLGLVGPGWEWGGKVKDGRAASGDASRRDEAGFDLHLIFPHAASSS